MHRIVILKKTVTLPLITNSSLHTCVINYYRGVCKKKRPNYLCASILKIVYNFYFHNLDNSIPNHDATAHLSEMSSTILADFQYLES